MTETGEEDRTGSEGVMGLPHALPVTLREIPEVQPSGPWWWKSGRSCALDVTLAAASSVECVTQCVMFTGTPGMPSLSGLVFALLAGVVLLLRRRWPVAVVLVAIAVIPTEMGYLLGAVGLYTVAITEVPRRVIGVLAGMQATGLLLISFIRLQQSAGQNDFDPPVGFIALIAALFAVVMTTPPVLLGLYVGARRRLVESLRERADGLERELSLLADRAEERADWARREERTRIAREMHDVVAHRVSLMVVHSTALQVVALKDPQKASKNAALVGDMGRQALTELRTMLGALRSTDGPAPVEASDDDRPLAPAKELPALAQVSQHTAAPAPCPQARAPGRPRPRDVGDGPSLAQLEALIGQSRAAGMTVELSVEGDRRHYTSRVERTAYRVVQEALTNVHKHAAGAATRVRLARRPTEVAVLVENKAPARGAAGAGLPSGGNGLLGMRERVTALGGGFVSGPTDSGGYRVSAIIPDRN